MGIGKGEGLGSVDREGWRVLPRMLTFPWVGPTSSEWRRQDPRMGRCLTLPNLSVCWTVQDRTGI